MSRETDLEQQQACMQRFIDLANAIQKEGVEKEQVSGALMLASCVYATFAMAGNQGGLTPSGVDKIVEAYRHSLQSIQKIKKQDAGQSSA